MSETVRKNFSIIALMVAVAVVGTILMLVSQEVYKTDRQVQKLEHDRQMLTWEIRALNGELAFLTRPDRLDQISAAMAQSISPASGASMVISPVQFSMMESVSIIPSRKPLSPRTVSAQTSPTPSQNNNANHFSSLLSRIGGDE